MTQRYTGIPTTEQVLAEVEQHHGTACPSCSIRMSGHDVVMSVAMGFKGAPRCLACLAVTFHRSQEDFREYILAYIRSRECYSEGWARADALEPSAATAVVTTPVSTPVEPLKAGGGDSLQVDTFWDAGATQCADLVLELRLRLKSLTAGHILQVRATDPAAPVDLPAWCRIARHELVHSEHPDYWIRC